MGTYFKIVNTSRREVFEPEGLKKSAFLREAEAFMKLMLGDWYKDNVCMISDAEDERTPAGTIYEDSEYWPNRAPQRTRPGGQAMTPWQREHEKKSLEALETPRQLEEMQQQFAQALEMWALDVGNKNIPLRFRQLKELLPGPVWEDEDSPADPAERVVGEVLAERNRQIADCPTCHGTGKYEVL